ncbi:DUF3572 domain-containing protein [Marinibacterium sp. SX1]|uniref:DUF3572 domain-containing protein n=1 Tax=Marinibacterium sp. SX1 TaxID=3388424 RepID=UPI003D176DA8
MVLSSENAETFALQVLGWLVTNDDLLPVFLGSTGADIDAVRSGAGDPGFLASVLDFLLMDDAWVIAACDALQVPYDRPQAARAALPGGQQVHWT